MPASTAIATNDLEPSHEAPLELSELRSVVQRDYALVWRFLRRLGVPEDQVDDAAQTVFARVLAREALVRSGVERAYLMKAALHISFEYRRANRRASARAADCEPDAVDGRAPQPDEALAQRQDRALLDAALDCLPTDLRAVLTLFEFEDMSFSEIAEVLGVPRGTVASRVRRARELFTQAAHRLARGGFG